MYDPAAVNGVYPPPPTYYESARTSKAAISGTPPQPSWNIGASAVPPEAGSNSPPLAAAVLQPPPNETAEVVPTTATAALIGQSLAPAEVRYNQLYAECRRVTMQRDSLQHELNDALAALRMMQLERHKADQDLGRAVSDNQRLASLHRQAMNDVSALQSMLASYQMYGPGYQQVGGAPPPPPPPPPPPVPTSPQLPPQSAATPTIREASPLPGSPVAEGGAPTGAARSSVAPLSAPSSTRKQSKKQQEVQAEQMTKEAFITHLERVIAQKDTLLAKLEGKLPDTVDAAAQACAGTGTARTQTDDVMPSGPSGDATVELRELMVDAGFASLRPIALQIAAVATQQTIGRTSSYGAGRSSPQTSAGGWNSNRNDRRSSAEGDVAALVDSPFLVPESSTPRWADEPVEFELRQSSAASSSPAKNGRPSSGMNDSSREAWKPRGGAGRTSRTL